MKEKCKACKGSIEEHRTHNGLCDNCLYSNREPRIISLVNNTRRNILITCPHSTLYELIKKQEKEFDEKFGITLDWGDGDMIKKDELKSHHTTSLIEFLEGLRGEIEREKKLELLNGMLPVPLPENIAFNAGLKFSLGIISTLLEEIK